ncbi:MAG: hypothetical protein ABIJ04_02385 [Bacteroidota bacterium]
MKRVFFAFIGGMAMTFLCFPTQACTTMIVTKGASADGSMSAI